MISNLGFSDEAIGQAVGTLLHRDTSPILVHVLAQFKSELFGNLNLENIQQLHQIQKMWNDIKQALPVDSFSIAQRGQALRLAVKSLECSSDLDDFAIVKPELKQSKHGKLWLEDLLIDNRHFFGSNLDSLLRGIMNGDVEKIDQLAFLLANKSNPIVSDIYIAMKEMSLIDDFQLAPVVPIYISQGFEEEVLQLFKKQNPLIEDIISQVVGSSLGDEINASLIQFLTYPGDLRAIHAMILAMTGELQWRPKSRMMEVDPKTTQEILNEGELDMLSRLPDRLYAHAFYNSTITGLDTEQKKRLRTVMENKPFCIDLKNCDDEGITELLKRKMVIDSVGLTDAQFAADYVDTDRDNAKRFLQHIDKERRRLWSDPRSFTGPVIPLVQSSKTGKSRLIKEVANTCHTVYISLGEPGETIPQVTTPVMKFFLGLKGRNATKGFISFITAVTEAVLRSYEEDLGPLDFIQMQKIESPDWVFWNDIIVSSEALMKQEIDVIREKLNAALKFQMQQQRRKGVLFLLAIDEVSGLMSEHAHDGRTLFSHLEAAVKMLRDFLPNVDSIPYLIIADTTSSINDMCPPKDKGGEDRLRPFYLLDTMDTKQLQAITQLDVIRWTRVSSLGRPGLFSKSLQEIQTRLLGGARPDHVKENAGLIYSVVIVGALTCTSMSPASVLSAKLSDLAVVQAISECRHFIWAAYVSEPAVGYAALRILDYTEFKPTVILKGLLEALTLNVVSKGDIGELIVKLIILLSKRAATNNSHNLPCFAGQEFDQFVRPVSVRDLLGSLHSRIIPAFKHYAQNNDNNFEASSKCRKSISRQKITEPLRMKEVLDELLSGQINATQFVKSKSTPTIKSLGQSYLRLAAIQCPPGQRRCDLVVPVWLSKEQSKPEPCMKGGPANRGYFPSNDRLFNQPPVLNNVPLRFSERGVSQINALVERINGPQAKLKSLDRHMSLIMIEVRNRVKDGKSKDHHISPRGMGLFGEPNQHDWKRPSLAIRWVLRDKVGTANHNSKGMQVMEFDETQPYRFGITIRGISKEHMPFLDFDGDAAFLIELINSLLNVDVNPEPLLDRFYDRMRMALLNPLVYTLSSNFTETVKQSAHQPPTNSTGCID